MKQIKFGIIILLLPILGIFSLFYFNNFYSNQNNFKYRNVIEEKFIKKGFFIKKYKEVGKVIKVVSSNNKTEKIDIIINDNGIFISPLGEYIKKRDFRKHFKDIQSMQEYFKKIEKTNRISFDNETMNFIKESNLFTKEELNLIFSNI